MDKCGKLWITFCIIYIVPFNTTFSVCVKNFKPVIWKNLERIMTINGGGISPIPQLHPKYKRRRFLTSFGMTDQENDFCFSGESSKGVSFPFRLYRRFLTSFGMTRLECHPEPTLRGVSSLNRGGEQTLLELYPKRILSLSRGKFERGLFPLSIE